MGVSLLNNEINIMLFVKSGAISAAIGVIVGRAYLVFKGYGRMDILLKKKTREEAFAYSSYLAAFIFLTLILIKVLKTYYIK